MKLKLLLLFILSSISPLQAGSLTLDKIAKPIKTACSDITCVLAKHPGALALTGFAVGAVIYNRARHEFNKVGTQEDLENLRTRINNNNFFSGDYQDRSEQLKNAIQAYETAQTKLKDLEAEKLGSIQAHFQHKRKAYQSLPKNLSAPELERAKKEAEEAEEEVNERDNDPLLQAARQNAAQSRAALDTSFDQESKNLKAIQNYYARLGYTGMCIALASAASYGIYKAYPHLKKWLAPYIK